MIEQRAVQTPMDNLYEDVVGCHQPRMGEGRAELDGGVFVEIGSMSERLGHLVFLNAAASPPIEIGG